MSCDSKKKIKEIQRKKEKKKKKKKNKTSTRKEKGERRGRMQQLILRDQGVRGIIWMAAWCCLCLFALILLWIWNIRNFSSDSMHIR